MTVKLSPPDESSLVRKIRELEGRLVSLTSAMRELANRRIYFRDLEDGGGGRGLGIATVQPGEVAVYGEDGLWHPETPVLAGGAGGSNYRNPLVDYVAGRYYGAEMTPMVTGAAAISADQLHAFPFWCRTAQTFDRIGLRITTGIVASNVRFGIYSSSADGLPDTLLTGALAQQATATSGADAENTISQALEADTLYWLAAVFSHGVSVSMLPPGAGPTVAGSASLSLGSASWLARSFAYAALPSSWGTPTYFAAQNMPDVRLRAA